jgi:D-sedoheptulose 7-phosphate isomerase
MTPLIHELQYAIRGRMSPMIPAGDYSSDKEDPGLNLNPEESGDSYRRRMHQEAVRSAQALEAGVTRDLPSVAVRAVPDPSWGLSQGPGMTPDLLHLRSLLPFVARLADEFCELLANGGTLFTFGNGGSAADAQHFAAELVGRYRWQRRPIAAISLNTDSSVLTCIANDYDYEDVFERQVAALVRRTDAVVAFSTSGDSPHVVRGLKAAHEGGAALTVLLTGASGGLAATNADRVVAVASSATARIQECHTLLLHLLSERIDQWAAGELTSPEAAMPGTNDTQRSVLDSELRPQA